MKKILFFLLCTLVTFTACDDSTDTLGSSLTNNEDIISIADGVFKVTSRSVLVDSVLSRNANGYLGKVKDPETGAYVKSNFITQFHCLENSSFPSEDSLYYGVKADSCTMRLYFNSYYGDSLTSMKATIYELSKPIEEGQNYYSTLDPEKAGMIRVGSGMLKRSAVYTLANGNYTDSLRNSSSYSKNIEFRLDQPYTARDGRTFDNYGSYIMQMYYDNPKNLKNSYNFIHDVCPGFYVKLENGIGCMANIYLSQLNIYYLFHDSIAYVGYKNFYGTEEVRQITQVTNDNDRMKALAADNSCTYIKTPAGIFTELTLPVEDIFVGHETDSINSAKVVLKCLADNTDDEYAFSAPTTLLMLQKDSLNSFFENREIADYRHTFLASYSSSSNYYSFGNIGQLVKYMYSCLPEDATKRAAWKEAHPNWNKVLLVPVSAGYTTLSSSSVLSSVSHDMSLSSVRLVGGSENQNGDIEMSIIYSKYKEK